MGGPKASQNIIEGKQPTGLSRSQGQERSNGSGFHLLGLPSPFSSCLLPGRAVRHVTLLPLTGSCLRGLRGPKAARSQPHLGGGASHCPWGTAGRTQAWHCSQGSLSGLQRRTQVQQRKDSAGPQDWRPPGLRSPRPPPGEDSFSERHEAVWNLGVPGTLSPAKRPFPLPGSPSLPPPKKVIHEKYYSGRHGQPREPPAQKPV